MILLFLLLLMFLFWVGLKITGAVLLALFWLFVKLPVAIILWTIGVICCCTLILIPLGLVLVRAGSGVVIPG